MFTLLVQYVHTLSRIKPACGQQSGNFASLFILLCLTKLNKLLRVVLAGFLGTRWHWLYGTAHLHRNLLLYGLRFMTLRRRKINKTQKIRAILCGTQETHHNYLRRVESTTRTSTSMHCRHAFCYRYRSFFKAVHQQQYVSACLHYSFSRPIPVNYSDPCIK